MRILVTGGAGYIGSHIVLELLQNDYDVIVIDSLERGSIETLEFIERVTGKKIQFLKDDLSGAIRLKNIDAIIHLAAFKDNQESLKRPSLYYQNNVGAALAVTIYARENNIPVIHSSSCAVYGNPSSPVTEDTLIDPITPYGQTKATAEKLISSCERYIHLRYFNPQGTYPNMPLRDGSDIGVCTIIKNKLAKDEVFELYGSHHKTRDGYPERDFIHIKDLAKVHINALTSDAPNGAYNIGAGRAVSIRRVIEAFEKYSGKKLKIEIKPKRSNEVGTIYADTSKAFKHLGYKPQFTLDDIVRSYYNLTN